MSSKKSNGNRSGRRRIRKGRKSVLSKIKRLTTFVDKTFETKTVDGYGENILLNHTQPDMINLTHQAAADGVDANERIGNNITLMSMGLKLGFRNMSCDDVIRVIVAQFFCNETGAQATANSLHSVLEYGGMTSGGIYSYDVDLILLSPYRVNSDVKNKVLFDQTYTTDTHRTGESTDGAWRKCNFFKKWENGLTVSYGNGAGHPQMNQIVCYIICSNANIISDTVRLDYTRRMRYKDA